MFCGKENPVCLVYPFLPWSLSCKCPSTPSPTHSGHRVCRQLEKKNTLRLEITGPPTIRVRLCQMFGFVMLSLPFWKVKTTGQNDLKGPQFSHLPESFGSAHRQPLFQPQQGGEHRRMVRKDLWATVQSVEVRGKQILSTEWTFVLDSWGVPPGSVTGKRQTWPLWYINIIVFFRHSQTPPTVCLAQAFLSSIQK